MASLTDRRLYRINSADPNKVSGRDISEMSNFCMDHRCGIMAEVRNPAELAVAQTLVASGVYPLDVDNPALNGSQRVMVGMTKR